MQPGTSHGFQRAVCTERESVSEIKTRAHGRPHRTPALAPAAAWTVSAGLPSKEGPEARSQPCTPWPGSASPSTQCRGPSFRNKPDKGRQPEDGAGTRPGRVTAPPLPAEWRGPERVSGRAGDTERPEASLISLLRVADTTLPFSWPGAGRTPRAVDSGQSRPVWWQFLVSAHSFYASTPPIFSYRRCLKHCTLPPAPSPHYRDPQGS